MIEAFIIHLLISFVIFALAALSLNLIFGWGGIIQLGHIGFVSIGAYTTSILTTAYGWPIPLSILAGMVLAAIAAVPVGWLMKKVKGDALSIILLGFSFTIYTVALNLDITRGALGIPGIPRPEWALENRWYLIFVALVLGLVVLFLRHLTRSAFGKVLSATRDDEWHARILGKKTFRVKLLTLCLSAAIAALSGALLAHFIQFIDPKSFLIEQLVLILSIVFVGGFASLRGTIVGAIILTFLPEAIDIFVTLPSASVGAVRGLLFSVLTLLVVLFRPKGLFGKIELPGAYADCD